MTYEIKDNPVHGKMLAENGKIIITDRNVATQLAERFNAKLVKAHSNRYMVQLPESINDIDECDCQSGQLQPDTYNQYPDHEVQMARQELYRTAKLAIMTHELLKQVGERQGLEGWVQSKLTRAADYIETVFDYLDYEMRYPSEMYNEADLNPGGSAQATPGTTPAGQQGLKPGQAPIQPSDGKTQTPGMVKMAKVDMNGKIQGQPIIVPQNSIKSKQQAGYRVIGESASGGTSGAGGIATSTGFGNGFLNGGPGAISRRPKKKKNTTEAWDMLDPGKPYGLANPRILTVGDDPQGIADFAVTGKNVLNIRPFNANQWNNTQQDARNHGYMLKYTGTNPEKAVVANSGDAPRLGRNMRGDKLESVAEAGPFSYTTKKPPRKGSLRDKMAKQSKEYRDKQPKIEPKDHMIGTAKVFKDVKEDEIPTYIVSVMDSATGEHRSIEVKVTSPEAARERAKARGYKVLSVKEKQGVKEGETSDTTWKVTYDYGPHQSNTIHVKAKSSADAWQAAKKEAAEKHHHSRIMAGQVTQVKDNVKESGEGGAIAAALGKRIEKNVSQSPRKNPAKPKDDWDIAADKEARAAASRAKKVDTSAYKQKTDEGGETGPKFTGYWKGTDKGKPGKKMVGDA